MIKFIDETVELSFYLDFIFCFLQEYKDEETYTIVSDIKKISKHYIKGSCIFDLLACLPFDRILGRKKENTRLYRLFKLFRVPRLLELLNVDRIKQTINDHYNKILQTAVENNVESKSYPILKALMLVQIYKIFRLIIIIFTSSYFLGILWHILVCDVQKTEWIDPNDHTAGAKTDNYRTVKLETHISEDEYFDYLIKEIYFAITTLSTIGYGDFHPVSQMERSIAAFILLWGVTIFSFIMGQFIEILMNYKSLWKVGKHKDLSKWIALLSRFNNGNPLNKELITKIEDFFDYYWQNNRMSAIENEMDQRFMDELPFYVQGEIIIDYLFTDFLYAYRNYFLPQSTQTDTSNFKDGFQDPKMRNFLVIFVRALEPRFYNQ